MPLFNEVRGVLDWRLLVLTTLGLWAAITFVLGCYRLPDSPAYERPKVTDESCCAICKHDGSTADHRDEISCWCKNGAVHFAGEVPVECPR